jgi:hypothetical protein
MGAVYGPSLKDLQKVLRCSDREMRILGQKMSETVILGSMEIWRQNAQEHERGRSEAEDQMIGNEIEMLEDAAIIDTFADRDDDEDIEAGAGAGAEAEERDFDAEDQEESDLDQELELELEVQEGAGRRFEFGRRSEERIIDRRILLEPEEGRGVLREEEGRIFVEEEISIEPEEGQLRFGNENENGINRGQEIRREMNFTGGRGTGVAVEIGGMAEVEAEVETEVGNGNGSQSQNQSRNGSGNNYEDGATMGDNVRTEMEEMGFGQGMRVGEIENPADDEASGFPTIGIEEEMNNW